jgi:hypothetical protein
LVSNCGKIWTRRNEATETENRVKLFSAFFEIFLISPKPKLPPKPKLTAAKSTEEEKPKMVADENQEMIGKLKAKIAEKKAQILGKRGELIEVW